MYAVDSAVASLRFQQMLTACADRPPMSTASNPGRQGPHHTPDPIELLQPSIACVPVESVPVLSVHIMLGQCI